MTGRPLIVIVDDSPRGLSALLDALIRRYGGDYRVVGHLSAASALTELERAKAEQEQVALVIADQWMPEMTGGELLLRAHALHHDAQRSLMVGWGDRRANETILHGCAFGQLDNYLLKPWSPPEVHLYPLIGEFLAEWARTHGPRLELVRVISEPASPRASQLRELLERNGVPHGSYLVDSETGRKLAAETGVDRTRLPAIVMLDGRILQDPSNAEIADALGASEPDPEPCDLAIVGAGPCGLAAAVTAASEGLRTVVIEREALGGQAGTSSLIRNFLGFPRGISGADLAQRAYQQAWLFGAKYVLARGVTGLRTSDAHRIVTLEDGRELTARTILIATGAEYRRLGIPSVDRFQGIGLQYAAGTDTALAVRDQDVVVCGGGNSAGQAVVHLAKTARRVILTVRGRGLSDTMSAYLVQAILGSPNVELRTQTEIVDADGRGGLEQLTLRHRGTGDEEIVRTSALFVMIGALPHTDWLDGIVARDHHGFLLTGTDVGAAMPYETSMRGVFAAGDVRLGSTKRLAAAVGEGSAAVRFVYDYLSHAQEGQARALTHDARALEREEHDHEPLRTSADL